MRISTIDSHVALASFVLDLFNANPNADKQSRGAVKQALDKSRRAAELARELRKQMGESYKDDPSMLAAMRDFRDGFKAANLVAGGKQQVVDFALGIARKYGVDAPAFTQPKPEKPEKPEQATKDQPGKQAASKPSKPAKPSSKPVTGKQVTTNEQASTEARGTLVPVQRRSDKSKKAVTPAVAIPATAPAHESVATPA